MNPFVTGNAIDAGSEAAETELPELKEFAWDFAHDTFRYDETGKPKIVTENDALEVWIYKCLKTQRWRYQCYRHGIYNDTCEFGVDLEQYIGKNPNNSETAQEIAKTAKEALLANPYIEDIPSLRIIEIHKANLTIEAGIRSIYGDLEIRMTV